MSASNNFNDHVDVSVVIPAYNSATTLQRALASVAAQTQQPVELLVVDDASSDATAAIAASWVSGPDRCPVTLIRQTRNLGPSAARNAGWDLATGTYVAFLDADDVWHPRKLELQFGWMTEHPEVGLTGHACPESQPDKLPEIGRSALRARYLLPLRFLFSNQFSTPTVMLRRSLRYRFREGKHYAEDYLLWLQVALDRVPVCYFEVPLAFIHKPAYGGSGLSAHLWRMEQGELATYWQLCGERRIAHTTGLLLMLLSLAKFARRYLMVAFRSLFR